MFRVEDESGQPSGRGVEGEAASAWRYLSADSKGGKEPLQAPRWRSQCPLSGLTIHGGIGAVEVRPGLTPSYLALKRV